MQTFHSEIPNKFNKQLHKTQETHAIKCEILM